MKHQYYQQFNEHVYSKELANGLLVYLIPKTDYNKTLSHLLLIMVLLIKVLFRLEKLEKSINQLNRPLLEHKLFDAR